MVGRSQNSKGRCVWQFAQNSLSQSCNALRSCDAPRSCTPLFVASCGRTRDGGERWLFTAYALYPKSRAP
eukprot:scaffold124034_cov72-Phaeocystis_antarctica.AAC.2